MDSKTLMRVIMLFIDYNTITKTFNVIRYNPGERLYREFLLYPTDRVNITYIPVSSILRAPMGDLYMSRRVISIENMISMNKFNRTFTYPYWHLEHNVLSYFKEAEYQISLTGVLQIFRPKAWMIIVLFLVLFNFNLFMRLAIANRFVPRGLRDFFGGSDDLANEYEISKNVLLSTYFVGCFILVEVFKANLSTKLTVDIDRNIDTLDDVFKYPRMRVVFQNNGDCLNFLRATRPDFINECLRRLKKFPRKKGETTDGIFNEGNAVYVGSLTHFEYFCLHGYKSRKPLHYMKNSFFPIFEACELSMGASTFIKNFINTRLMHFWETGHQIRSNNLLNKKSCSKYLNQKQGMEFSKIYCRDVIVIFLVFAAFAMLSILVLFGEIRCASKNTGTERTLREIELETYSCSIPENNTKECECKRCPECGHSKGSVTVARDRTKRRRKPISERLTHVKEFKKVSEKRQHLSRRQRLSVGDWIYETPLQTYDGAVQENKTRIRDSLPNAMLY